MRVKSQFLSQFPIYIELFSEYVLSNLPMQYDFDNDAIVVAVPAFLYYYSANILSAFWEKPISIKLAWLLLMDYPLQ